MTWQGWCHLSAADSAPKLWMAFAARCPGKLGFLHFPGQHLYLHLYRVARGRSL